VERLRRVAEVDLQRNLAFMDAAAKEIDPKRSTAEVVAEVYGDEPLKDGVLALATEQSNKARQFTFIKYQCATIPDIRRFMLGDDAGPAP